MSEETRDSIQLSLLTIGDEKEPNAVRLPDTEFISALGRASKHDMGKKYMYEGVTSYKKMIASEWKPIVIHSTVTILGIISTAVVAKSFYIQAGTQVAL